MTCPISLTSGAEEAMQLEAAGARDEAAGTGFYTYRPLLSLQDAPAYFH